MNDLKQGLMIRSTDTAVGIISVMISELGNYNGLVFNLIYNAMLIGDSTRPISGEAMLYRFRFSYSFVWHPFNVTDYGVDPF